MTDSVQFVKFMNAQKGIHTECILWSFIQLNFRSDSISPIIINGIIQIKMSKF